MSYLSDALKERAPQSESIRKDQVENSAGGFVWEANPLDRLRRFLILGTEGGTYYANERDASRVQLDNVRSLFDDPALGRAAVAMTVEISEQGLAHKNDPALLVLAMASVLGDLPTRQAAYRALPHVARIGTHLFHFCQFRQDVGGGWGRGMANAVGDWYANKDADKLAYQLVKYRQRDGWTHRDVMRLSHPEAPTPEHAALYDFVCGRPAIDLPQIVRGYIDAQSSKAPQRTAEIVEEFNLPRECIQPEHLDDKDVQEALLEHMPMTAMVRNLGNMSKSGLLTPGSVAEAFVCRRLRDPLLVRQSIIHPIGVLAALSTYSQGHSARGSGTWVPCPRVVDALNDAFYLAFHSVVPADVRTLIALDVSGSMEGHEINGIPGLDARRASAAMALVTAATEPHYEVVAFAAGPGSWSMDEKPERYHYMSMGLTPVPMSPRQRLDDVLHTIDALHFGGTDCALPILWAQDTDREYDHFVIYTDNETWAGKVHPAQALKDYRQQMKVDARMTVVGMCANDFSIADPQDDGMLDVVGFDASAPALISDFGAGRL